MDKKFSLGHNYDVTEYVKQFGWWGDSDNLIAEIEDEEEE